MADKKMKTAFIRVSAVNNTEKEGVVTYSFSDVVNVIKEWSTTCRFTYYMIEHNGEEGDTNQHFHAVLNFGQSPIRFSTIKNKFPYGRIETCKSLKATVQYLVHLNDLSKRTYEWSEVVTNDPNIDRFKVLSSQALDLKLKKYIDQIMTGEIREFNFAASIEPEVFAKRKTQLYNALELYRMRVLQDKSRKISVVVCQGESGTGKTTYCKAYAEANGMSICISSSSNDPFQDYKGEDILVLDELRSDVFSLSDLLKILDNHTKSTTRSRYNNKLFLGKTIFITTNEEWQDWYKNNDTEECNALKRRASMYFKFYRIPGERHVAAVDKFKWNIDAMKYNYVSRMRFDFSKYVSDGSADDDEFDMLFG